MPSQRNLWVNLRSDSVDGIGSVALDRIIHSSAKKTANHTVGTSGVVQSTRCFS